MELQEKIIIGVITTFISSAISTLVGLCIAKFNAKNTEQRALDSLLIQINTLNMQYPYLENAKFIENYKMKKSKEEEYSRYDSYCTIIFNFLERLFLLYDFNEAKVKKFVHFQELIELHSGWWTHSDNYLENIKGYDPKFVEIVSKFLSTKS